MINGLENCELIIDKILEYQKNLVESYLRIIIEYQERLIEILTNFANYKKLEENSAVFRARIQKGGRIAIPEIEREAMNLKEGDIVRVIIIKD
uniref:AbrB/MazE/SpoVT family DNA-binding domain-containing protein n=1 Tax=Geoglobus ahangari TaxID=113653 RepID=A0A7C3UL16_9EURY